MKKVQRVFIRFKVPKGNAVRSRRKKVRKKYKEVNMEASKYEFEKSSKVKIIGGTRIRIERYK